VNNQQNQFQFRYFSDSSFDPQPLVVTAFVCARCDKDRWQPFSQTTVVLQNLKATLLYFMGVRQFDISGTVLSETNDGHNWCYSVMLGKYYNENLIK
jgi:hypothetical protein